jgi:hypothetical protein
MKRITLVSALLFVSACNNDINGPDNADRALSRDIRSIYTQSQILDQTETGLLIEQYVVKVNESEVSCSCVLVESQKALEEIRTWYSLRGEVYRFPKRINHKNNDDAFVSSNDVPGDIIL